MEADPPMPSVGDAPPGKKKRRPFGCGFWVLLAIVLLLFAAVATPNLIRAYRSDSPNACVNNLRQIQAAKEKWALENHKDGGAVPIFADIAPYLGGGINSASNIICPSAGTQGTFDSSYEIGAITNPPKCKISVDFPNPHVLELKR